MAIFKVTVENDGNVYWPVNLTRDKCLISVMIYLLRTTILDPNKAGSNITYDTYFPT